ncbi:MAG: hypothetical protein IKA23_07505 [Akkermansia sp.]|nr:hypothetical protein [Akkermansia sp.]MBR2313441.1 hypothetical protein [Akkermansia sp.]
MIYRRSPQLEQAQDERRRLLALFSTPEGEQVLSDLERRFETHLPVFQGKSGSYDPLDAMRRDAHREIFLVIRHQLELARQEAKQTQHNHD